MKATVTIKNIAVYYPENIVGNDYFIKHFDSQGKDIRGLLKAMGRENRYLSLDEDENSLSMGIISAKRVLEKSNLRGKDIDLIIFCSATPEFITPSNALKIHQAINGSETAIVYDLNSNCIGMLAAFEQACRNMQYNSNIKNALIIGAEQFNRYAKKTDEIVYPNFSDSSCAVILERSEEDINSDFIDSTFYVNSSFHDNVLLPKCGLSKVNSNNVKLEDKMISWIQFDMQKPVEKATEDIEFLLKKHNISKRDVKKYFFSQLSKKNNDLISDNLMEPKEKFIYIGDEFGYTGTNSLFIALAVAIEKEMVKRGDILVFWTMGVGWTISTVLIKY